jgi:hypothetical protein
MNDIIPVFNQICVEKNVSPEKTQILRKWVVTIIKALPKASPVRIDSFSHEGADYFLLSFPMTDMFASPWDIQSLNLSTTLYRASKEINFVPRFQNQGNFSGVTLRVKLEA